MLRSGEGISSQDSRWQGQAPGHSKARHAGKGGMLAAGWEHALPVLAHGHRSDGYLHCMNQKAEPSAPDVAEQCPAAGRGFAPVPVHFRVCGVTDMDADRPCQISMQHEGHTAQLTQWAALLQALLPLLPITSAPFPPFCCRTAGHCSHHLNLCLLKLRTEVH